MTATNDDEPTLTSIMREFPGWEAWRGVSGRCYARRATRPRTHRADADGEDPRDLRDMIIRWIGQRGNDD